MASKSISSIKKSVLEKIKPSKEEIDYISKISLEVFEKLKRKIEKSGLEADIFVGGSVAKDTLVKNKQYDVDVFIRFWKEKDDRKISHLTEKILINLFGDKVKRIRGSRDYFSIYFGENVVVEIIPVIKILRPDKMENVTDLSYFHVNYIAKKIKRKKLQDEVRLAKVFCAAQRCYGAESYIKGFSGYSLELLISYYGNFMNLIRNLAKNAKDEKIVIDEGKKYKNKRDIFINVNSSKLQSPIILIDPTYEQRNALAALSEETFERLKKACRDFLKNPSENFFEEKVKDINQVRENAKRKGNEFVLIEAHTEKQEGDIAGSKLLKFYNFFEKEISRFFKVKDKGFNYNVKQAARYYFVVESYEEIEFKGPLVEDKKNNELFKKVHAKTFVKNGRLYAKEKVEETIQSFFEKWKRDN